jgi:FtsH-binding integral membrane protein
MDDRTLYKNQRTIDMTDGVDQGLRAYMIQVFNYMALGLGITGLVAFTLSNSPQLMATIWGTGLQWVVILAPLAMALFLSFKINSLSFATAQLLFFVYAGLMGLSLSSIFLVFTGQSITRVFFITSSVFAAMSLYGYTTKRDLTGMGSFLLMGVIGIVIASLVNMFLKSSVMQFVISVIGVIVFTGLTAYDVQQIKEVYYEQDAQDTMGKKAIIGALRLYLDFINLFISLLHLFGDRR